MELFPFPEIRNKQGELMQEAEETIEEGKNLVVHAPTGLGKCVAGGTQVLTDEGISRIDEISSKKIHCNSFDEDLGVELSSSEFLEKEKDQVVNIQTGTGRAIKVTKDHKLLRLKRGNVEWVKAGKIEEDDFIASPRKIDLPNIDFSPDLSVINDRDVRVSVSPDLDRVLDQLKKETEVTDRELSERMNIPRNNFTAMRKSRPVKLRHIEKLIKESKRDLEDFELEKVSRSNRNTIEMPEIDESFCYFLGIMVGDGGIYGKRETIGMTTADKEVEEFFRSRMKKFNSQVRKVHGDEYGYKSSNKSVAWLLGELGIPKGEKKDLKVPNCVLTSRENLAAFISGLLDTDGSIDKQGKVEFSTKSRQLSEQLLVLFPVFGIRPVRKEIEIKGKKYQRLFISNQNQLQKLHEEIGFRIQRKRKRLQETLDKHHNPNKDIIPEVEDLIKTARKESGVPYSRKPLRRRLESYETGSRRPSRKGLKEVLDQLDFKENKFTERLLKLVESDVFWDKVESKELADREKVYDLNVSKNHNFTGNNVVLHNTAATLTPALEYAVENNKKVFFLTPRHSQHQIAVETVKKIQERHNVELTVVDLLGKKWLCNIDGVEEMTSGDFKDYCQTLRDEERCDFYTAMYDMDEHKLKDEAKKKLDTMEGNAMHSQEFKQASPNFCPYYMMMELARRSDLMIADYFHIFHPGVRESIFERAGCQLEDTILIVDEAHNLPSRTRSLFSTSLSIPQIDRGITEAEKFGFYDIEENLEQLMNVVKSLAAEKFEAGSHEEKIKKKDLKDSVSNFHEYEEFIVDLEAVASEVRDEQERSYCGGIAEFLDDWNGEDNGYFRGIKRTRSSSGNRYIQIKYSCLDPQVSTRKALNDCHSSILMSGTLTPQKMYVDLLGLKSDKTNTRAFSSPFPGENELDLLVPTVTTKYSERGESMYNKYAWYLSKSFEAVPGNCGVFFPSYKMMKTVKEELKDRTDREIFTERQDMNKEEKQEMLNAFASKKEEGAVLLGVAAGSFGEGIDYPGEILKAVFVVGLPLQKPDLETKGLINFYDYKFGKGWDYGYSYPAMNRAIQAAGRCIRSKDDEGAIVYMDERYDWSNYRKVFPPGKKLKKTKAPWKEIEDFF